MAKTRQSRDSGASLLEGVEEIAAWKRGEIALPVRIVPNLAADQVKAIRKSVARSPPDFAARFGIPDRTLEGGAGTPQAGSDGLHPAPGHREESRGRGACPGGELRQAWMSQTQAKVPRRRGSTIVGRLG